MTAVAYIRVSDVSQIDGHSLNAQERLFHELCLKRGWTAGKLYREEGKSAHSDSIAKRPVFRQLLDDAAAGKFDVVVVHTLDRWARNLKVLLETVAILSQHGVGLVSISENLDWSTPEGRLVARTVGSFGEFFSDMLGTHVKKGIAERAIQGLHLGGIPFGYQPCWERIDGERRRTCDPEHPGGMHLFEPEAAAVTEMFRRYATGAATLATLAIWLNDQGLRTRNNKKLPGPDGRLTAGPKLFTTASVRGILHNPFYAGLVKHKDELYQGSHETLVSKQTFDLVQTNLRRNSGRSKTLAQHPEREYLLKGIIRCAFCMMPMWSQTYTSGQRYYREHRASRSIAACPSAGGSIKCLIPDEQIGRIVSAIELGPAWQEQIISMISVKDEVERIHEERKRAQERLKRLGQAFVDGVYDEADYQRQRRQMKLALESLVVPEADAAEAAGNLIQQLPQLWEEANPAERRQILLSMLDGVYVDAKEERRIVALKPKPAFQALFQIATTKADSGVVLYNEKAPALSEGSDGSCSWWRRGSNCVESQEVSRNLATFLTPLYSLCAPNTPPGQLPRTTLAPSRFQAEMITGEHGCVKWGCQGVACLTIALRMIGSFRMHAVKATFLGFPAAHRR